MARTGMHSRAYKYHFENDTMDMMFQWALGAQTHGGSEIGETFCAARRIQDGDPGSWVKEWTALAQRVEARGEAALKKGHRVSARESFLRAYTYYRLPNCFISPLKDLPLYRQCYEKAHSCFRRMIPLMDVPLAPFQIPFEGKALPGYFLRAGKEGEKRKTLIMIGGGDTFVEDLYAYIGPAGLKRGYNVLIVDLPGQGILPADGLPMRHDSEVPMKAVVDFALSLPEVDPDRLAACGISGGGYLVPRAVTREKRIRAIVTCSMIIDFYKHFTCATKIEMFGKKQNSLLFKLITRLQRAKYQAALTIADAYPWRWGAGNILELLEVVKRFSFDPAEITCPTLNMVGEFEHNLSFFEWGRHVEKVSMERISNPNKHLIIMPEDEGADGHAVGTNISVAAQTFFDWLDEVFDDAHGDL